MTATSEWIPKGPLRSMIPAFVAVVIALVATAGATWVGYKGVVSGHRAEKQLEAAHAANSIEAGVNEVIATMLAARGLVASSNAVEPAEWKRFINEATDGGRAPGAVGFAYIQRILTEEGEPFSSVMRDMGMSGYAIHARDDDKGGRDHIAPIRYMEPADKRPHVIGFDVSSAPAARLALERAARGASAAATEAVQLTDLDTLAILVYLPMYDRDATSLSPDERLDATIGWVGAPIAMRTLLAQAVTSDKSSVARASLRDAFGASIASIDEAGAVEPTWRDTIDVVIADRELSMIVEHHAPAAGAMLMETLPISLTALVLSGTIVAMVMAVSGAGRKATGLAERMTERLRESEQRLSVAVDGSQDGLWDWDLERDTVYYASRWKELLGCTDDVGDSPSAFLDRISPASLPEFEEALNRHIKGAAERFDIAIEMRHADGDMRWMLCRAAAVRDETGKAARVAGSLADITDLKRAQERLQHIALHDRLTDLPNRLLFTERIEHAIQHAAREPGYRFAVLFFDFDRFKVINDSLGHSVGDALLVSIAERFRAHLRPSDTAARFGGDEFVVLLDGVQGVDEARRICQELLAVFAAPHLIEGHEVVSTASIGVVGSDGQASAEAILRDADAAMYVAKSSGKAQYRVFDAALHHEAMLRLQLERDLRHANFDEQCEVLYQPIVCLRTGELAGFEALLRWNHAEHGSLSPDKFVEMAEETALIVPLGEWTLSTAMSQVRHWRDLGERGADVFVNVNLSKRQLLEPDLPDRIATLMRGAGVGPDAVKLEITETTIMDNQRELTSVMSRIRELGLKLAMDDFGTGHSSLSCLHDFPIDVLKIDRSFVVNVEGRRQFAAVLHAIITLAQHLDLDVVAEGVENRIQLAQLQAMDCAFAQGYLFARPLNAADATSLILNGVSMADAA